MIKENIDPDKLVGKIMYTKYLKEDKDNIKPTIIFLELTDTNSWCFYYNVYYVEQKKIINVGYEHKKVKEFISSYEEKTFTEKQYNSDYVWMII